MIKLIDILNEIKEEEKITGEFSVLNTDGVSKGTILTLYHATKHKDLEVGDKPIHLGTKYQADDRIDMLWDYSPVYYLHQVKVRLSNPYPKILWDVDKGVGHSVQDFLKYGNYNEYVYYNKAEGFPEYRNENFSLFIVNFSKSYISSKVVEVVETGHNDIKEEKESLHKWFSRQGGSGKSRGWVDCNTCRTVDGKKKCKACGRQKGEKRAKYPSCRPTPSQCSRPGKGKTWGKTK